MISARLRQQQCILEIAVPLVKVEVALGDTLIEDHS